MAGSSCSISEIDKKPELGTLGQSRFGGCLVAVEVHVEGRVTQGSLPSFAEGVKRYIAYARENGYAVPRVLQGLSGPMNTIRFVYTYEDLAAYQDHEARTMRDRGYAEVASGMGFVDGSLIYTIYRQEA